MNFIFGAPGAMYIWPQNYIYCCLIKYPGVELRFLQATPNGHSHAPAHWFNFLAEGI